MSKKIKNPEKYIKVLKNKIEFLENQNNRRREDAGIPWRTIHDSRGIILHRLQDARKVRLGDGVILYGTITKIETIANKHRVEFDLKYIHRKEFKQQ